MAKLGTKRVAKKLNEGLVFVFSGRAARSDPPNREVKKRERARSQFHSKPVYQ